MDDEKRMVDAYEIKHAIHIGDKEVLFGVDVMNLKTPYMVCYCSSDNPFGVDTLFKAVGSDDYLEMMTEFNDRVKAQVDVVKAEREQIPYPLEPYTIEQCIPNDYSMCIENKVAVLRPERLRPEYRTSVNQLALVLGGFGAQGNARGRAVYIVSLYFVKEARWNRGDILGLLKPEYMPEWARNRLSHLQAERQTDPKHREPAR